MEINVQHDPKTGEQRILSANRVSPLEAASRGVKVYDDGRKVVYEVTSSGGVSTSTVENGWSSAQVDELVQRAARPSHAGGRGDSGRGQVTVTPVPRQAYVSPADVDDLSPPSCAPPSIPSSPPAQITLQRETRLGMMPLSSAPITTQPGSSANQSSELSPMPQASTEHPVTMVFLGYQDVEDTSESRRLLGFDGAVKAEVVLIDEDDEKSLREKTVTDISIIDGTAADLVSGRPATSEAVSTELSSDGREPDSASSPPANPEANISPPPGLTPATGTDKRKRCQCCILMWLSLLPLPTFYYHLPLRCVWMITNRSSSFLLWTLNDWHNMHKHTPFLVSRLTFCSATWSFLLSRYLYNTSTCCLIRQCGILWIQIIKKDAENKLLRIFLPLELLCMLYVFYWDFIC